MAWVKMGGNTNAQNIVGSDNTPFYVATANRFQNVVSTTTISDGATQQNLLNASENWIHVAGMYDATTNTSSLYFNGIEDTASRFIHTTITPPDGLLPWKGNVSFRGGYNRLNIGAYDNTNGRFSGQMDDIRIYPLVLTDSEITSILNAELPILNLRNTASTDNTVSLTWDSVAGATGYNIKQSINSGAAYTVSAPASTSTNSVTITGLSPGTAYVFAVSAVGGVSSIINTSTTGGEIVRIVGTASTDPVDTVGGRTITAVAPGATIPATPVTSETGVSRRMLDINGTGYFSVGGDFPGGTHSVCFWVRSRGAIGNLFQIVSKAGGAGAATGNHSFIWKGSSNYAITVDSNTTTITAAQTRISKAVTKNIVNNVIETVQDHGFTENQSILFDTIYNSTDGATVTNRIVVGTTYFVGLIAGSPNKFSIKDSSGGSIKTLPSSPYFSNVYNNVAPVNNQWVHLTGVFDSITSTTVLYVKGADTASNGKTVIPRRVGVLNSTLIFPSITKGANPDIIQIGRYNAIALPNNVIIDDVRIFNKVISESEIDRIVAGTL